MSIYLGIDPGKSGGIAGIWATEPSDVVFSYKLKDATEADVCNWINGNTYPNPSYAVIERVSSSPQQGVVSAFTFGRSYGFLRGLLIAMQIPFVEVSPQKWQKAMGCLSKGDKNVTKARAQQIYPKEKITHANADALLLATYCRRYKHELF